MITIRRMKKSDFSVLWDMALRAFEADYKKFGEYPPMINLKKKKFLPPRILGKTILKDDVIIGGSFVVGFLRTGEIGNIFIDPLYQHKSYGKQAIQLIEKSYPRIKKWKIDTPADNNKLHKFYESLGYCQVGEKQDKMSSIIVFQYEKLIK